MDLKRSLQNLFNKSKAFDPASQMFMSVDRDSLEKDLELKERSEEQGTANIPKADTTGKDAIATDIDAYLMEVLRRGKDELQYHLRAMGLLDSFQSIDKQLTELRTKTLETLNKFYAKCRSGVNDLYPRRRVVADGELAYEKFRSENNLERPGHYPENRFREFWWIILALVIEALFNSWALGTAHQEGPLGVFLETVFIAAVNVLVGVAIGGYFWRQTYHIKMSRVVFGYAVTFVFVVFVLLFNFVIGHYRDSLIGLQTQTANADVVRFLAAFADLFRGTVEKAFSDNFWAFGGLMSVLLIIVGVAMSVFAAIKAFGLDDPYPGYGNVSRAQDKRNADYADLFSELQEELEEVAGETNKVLSNIFEIAQMSQGTIKDHEDTLKALESKYLSWISELTTVGTALYANYRQLNEQHRTEPSPAAFQIDFSLPKEMATPPVRPTVAEEQDIKHLRKLKDACIQVVNQASNKYLTIYKTIGELAPEDVKAIRATTYDVEVEKVNTEFQALAETRGISAQQG